MQKINFKTKDIVKILAIIFSILIIFSFAYIGKYRMIKVGEQKFFVELVTTSEKQAQGLGGRAKIRENEGMLFDFAETGKYSIWMKDMQFDLDILWIKGEKIVYIAKNISHKSSETINPQIMADKVLEIKSGLVDKYNFKIGDSVKIN